MQANSGEFLEMRKLEASSPLAIPLSPPWDDRSNDVSPRGLWSQWPSDPVETVETVEPEPSDAMLLEMGTSEVEKWSGSEEERSREEPLRSFRALAERIASLRREVEMYSKVVVSCRTRIADLRGKAAAERAQCSALRCFINASTLRDVREARRTHA